MIKRKLLALLGMTLVSTGAAVYLGIKEMKIRTQNILMDYKEENNTEENNTEESEEQIK